MRGAGRFGRLVGALMGVSSYGRALWARAANDGPSAETLLRAGRFAEAEHAFRQRAEARPRDARPLVALGHLALMRDDLPKAEAHLKQALTLARKHKGAQALLAEAHYRRDDFGAAAKLYEAVGRRPVAEKLRSFAGRRPYTLEGAATARLPFVRREPLPVVKARVNGADEAHFLVDTGGGELILDASFAQKICATRFGSERGSFGGGTQAAFAHGAVDSVALGDLTVRRVPVHIMDLQPMGAAVGEPGLAGIIGTVLFYRLRVTIDYPGENLVLRRRDAPADANEARGIEVPFGMADDHYMVAEGTFNDGSPLLFLVDTGLGGAAFTCPPSTLRAVGIDLRSAPRGEGSVPGGVIGVQSFDVATLTLGAARREHLRGIAGAFPPQIEWGFGFRIGGLISHQFFLPYAVTFDFATMLIRLVPGPGG